MMLEIISNLFFLDPKATSVLRAASGPGHRGSVTWQH